MIVTVIDRRPAAVDAGLCRPYMVDVEISDNCPICNGPRGKPILHQWHQDGDTLSAHKWVNPCGHIDLYSEVIKEAEASWQETIS